MENDLWPHFLQNKEKINEKSEGLAIKFIGKTSLKDFILGVGGKVNKKESLTIMCLYFGSLVPGILIHWVNNFLLFTVIASEVTTMPVPTLLVDARKKKKAASVG